MKGNKILVYKGKVVGITTIELRKTNERIKDMRGMENKDNLVFRYIRKMLVMDLGEMAVRGLGL